MAKPTLFSISCGMVLKHLQQTDTTNRFGQANSAIVFNGNSNDYVSTSFTPPSGTSSRTFSLWLNTASLVQDPNSAGLTGSILSYGGVNVYNGDGIDVGIESDGAVFLGSSFCGVTTSTTWNDGAWHHFVVVIPTNSSVAQIQLFVDGVLQSNYNYYNSNTIINTSTTYPLLMGKSVRGGYAYVGSFDDVRIYNRALSSSEVAQLYAIESPPIISIQKAVYITSSNLWTGSNYQVQVSSDLINWTNQGSVFTATTNYWQSTNYWDVADWNQLFFRLQVAP